MAIKIKFDTSRMPEEPTFILMKKSTERIGQLQAKEIVVKDLFNGASEFSFRVYKELDGVLDPMWKEIVNFRLVYCPEIDKSFELTFDLRDSMDDGTYKQISCIELPHAELSQINLYDIHINTAEDIIRDDYVNTVLYNPDNPKGSLLNRIMEKAPHYSIGHVDDTIAGLFRVFEFDDTTILDAFEDIAEEIGCVFKMDSGMTSDGTVKRIINVYDLWQTCLNDECSYRDKTSSKIRYRSQFLIDKCPYCGGTNFANGYGDDTTIFVTKDELGEDIDFQTETDQVKNCFRLVGGDDLMTATIRNCNPNGSSYIWYIPDYQKADMSQDLQDALDDYDAQYAYYQNEYSADIDVDDYNILLDKYKPDNQTALEHLDNLTSPVTGYSALMEVFYDAIDFEGFLRSSMMPSNDNDDTTAALEAAKLTADNISPVAITTLRYASQTVIENAVLSMAKAYVEKIYRVTLVTESFATETSGSLITSATWVGHFDVVAYSDMSKDDTDETKDMATSDTITVLINSDYDTYAKQKIEKILANEVDNVSVSALFKLYDAEKDEGLTLDEFKEELNRYGLNPLNSLYSACNSVLEVMQENGDASDTTTSIYQEVYTPYYQRLQAIEAEIAEREEEVGKIVALEKSIYYEELLEDGETYVYGGIAYDIQTNLNMENYLGTDLWHELYSFRREDTYENSNYISEGLDNAELIADALEFIEKANDEIYKSATMQHTISTTLANLLVIKKFEPLLDYFEVGNWIRVEVDDVVYKLRLIEYEMKYDSLENIDVEFSDVTLGKYGISDQASIIEQATKMATSYEAVKRQASSGKDAQDTIDGWSLDGLDITNLRLMSGADNQTQTWDEHGMLFRSYNEYNGDYDDEQMKIVNSTIAITDDDWETVKTAVGKFYYTDPETGELTEAYGVNAEVLIGQLILGEQLGLYNSAGTLSFDENGLVITNGTNTFTVDPNSEDGLLSITKNTDDSSTKIFYIDSNGDAVFKGTVNATALYIGSDDSETTIDEYIDNAVTESEGNAVVEVYEEFTTTTTTSEPGDDASWTTTYPSDSTDYIWRRVVTKYRDETISYGSPSRDGKDGEDAITVVIDSNTGNIFRNKDIQAILTCHVYKGSEEVTDQVTSFNWIKKNSDGTVDEDWNRSMATNIITIDETDVYSKAIFICEVEL